MASDNDSPIPVDSGQAWVPGEGWAFLGATEQGWAFDPELGELIQRAEPGKGVDCG